MFKLVPSLVGLAPPVRLLSVGVFVFVSRPLGAVMFVLVHRLLQPELVNEVKAGLHAQLLDQQVAGVLHLTTGNVKFLTLSRILSFFQGCGAGAARSRLPAPAPANSGRQI